MKSVNLKIDIAGGSEFSGLIKGIEEANKKYIMYILHKICLPLHNTVSKEMIGTHKKDKR